MKKFYVIICIVFVFVSIYWYIIGYTSAKNDYINGEWVPIPSAMDVYQGKTTLQYTIIDGEKIDSIVVFKNECYEPTR